MLLSKWKIVINSFTMEDIILIPNNSLIVETPEAGRKLAVTIARLIIKLTQPNDSKRMELRNLYAK